MEFPLAHDENGSPLTVPATATGWLVRRHAGGRGRPGAVYDADGRPLVVPLDSTAADLRSYGCRPATYRLDALDTSRQPLGVTAYTELRRDSVFDADEGADGQGSTGAAAVAALARAVEAMQRVQAERERAQAERERAQAEMISRLIERLAPPPPPQKSRNLRDALGEFKDVSEMIRNLAPDDDGDGGDDNAELMKTVQQAVQLGTLLMAKKGANQAAKPKAASSSQAAPKAEAPRNAAAPANDAEVANETASPASDGPKQMDQASFDKLTAVFTELSLAEQFQAREYSQSLPPEEVTALIARLTSMTVDDAVVEVRRILEELGAQEAA